MNNISEWNSAVLGNLSNAGPDGIAAVDYIRRHRTKLGFQKQSDSTWAKWTITRAIYLNPKVYNPDIVDDAYMLSLIAHEAHHLRQGPFVALSVYGELEAWQLGFRVYHAIKGNYRHHAIDELMTLHVGWDRAVLQHATELMQEFSGKGYRIDLLPFYPLGHEVAYRLFRKVPDELLQYAF